MSDRNGRDHLKLEALSHFSIVAAMPQRDIAEIFRAYSRPSPSTIPAKRPSPGADEDVTAEQLRQNSRKQEISPETPNTIGTSQSTLFTPGTSKSIAMRSTRPSPNATPTKRLLLQNKNGESNESSISRLTPASQSILKEGRRVAVKGSDDEDSDSLCSLDDILGRRQRASGIRPWSSSPDESDRNAGASLIGMSGQFTNKSVKALIGREGLRKLTNKANGFNFDINLLLDDHFGDEEVEANVSKTKQRYRDLNRAARIQQKNQVDKAVLASVVDQESSESTLQRLLAAVERTEALATQVTWSMFDGKQTSEDLNRSMLSAKRAGHRQQSTSNRRNPALSNSSYLMGHVRAKATLNSVDEELLQSLVDNVATESSEDLKQSYIQILCGVNSKWISTHLTAARIEDIFCRLGANPTKAQCRDDIAPESQRSNDVQLLATANLLSVIDLLSGLSANLTYAALSRFVQLLLRLAIDAVLMAESEVCIRVEDAIAALLGHREERVSREVAACILDDIGARLHDSALQALALKHILPTSPRAANLRISLARRFLDVATETSKSFQNAVTDTDTSAMVDLNQLSAYLDNPVFNTVVSKGDDSSVDYSALSSLVSIFDVALGDGGRPLPAITPKSDTSVANIVRTSANSLPSSPSNFIDERNFNQQVDLLADQVKAIHTSIADTGASHLRRTEAKEALNALHFRLLYGVRTKSRPKQAVFGGGGGANNTRMRIATVDGANSEADAGFRGGSSDLMQKFLSRQSRPEQTEKQITQNREKEKEKEKGSSVASTTTATAIDVTTATITDSTCVGLTAVTPKNVITPTSKDDNIAVTNVSINTTAHNARTTRFTEKANNNSSTNSPDLASNTVQSTFPNATTTPAAFSLSASSSSSTSSALGRRLSSSLSSSSTQMSNSERLIRKQSEIE